ncbi:MAG: hypothetical protein J6P98_01130, partial [Clostridia bacterium]|nr:hypothetical protein [Clostridia bacterium]
LPSFLFTACLGPISIDQYGYVISIGAEKGKEHEWYFTFALQRELTESNTQTEGGASLICQEADSLDEAVNAVEARVPFALSFSRVGFFVFSREIAEEGAVSRLFTLSLDSQKIRSSSALLISEGSVAEFMGGLSANNDANITKLQTAVMLDSRKTGRVVVMSISRLFEAAINRTYDFCAPYGILEPDLITDMDEKSSEAEGKDPLEDISLGENAGGLRSYVNGTALFDGVRMTGLIDREQTLYLNIANAQLDSGSLTVNTQRGSITVLLSQNRAKKRLLSLCPPRAEISISLNAGVHACPVDMTEAELASFVEIELPSLMEAKLNELFLVTKAANCDAFRLGMEAIKLTRTQYEWETLDFKSKLPELELDFIVSIHPSDSAS